MKHPIEQVQWRATTDLHPNTWNPNFVAGPELRLLERSLLTTGWVQPILAAEHDGSLRIVDGFHRWGLARTSKRLLQRDGGLVPVCTLALSLPEAMLLTVRINRAKGTHAAVQMHLLVHALLTEHGMEPQQVADEMGATLDEVNVLAQDGVFAVRNISEHLYSKAWRPRETGESIEQARTRNAASRKAKR